MSKTPNYDSKIQPVLDTLKPNTEITCPISGEKRTLTENEITVYRKHQAPPKNYAPIVRMQMLTTQWPGGQWWYNKHAESGAPIICPVHPATGIKVLPDKEWFAKDFSDLSLEVDLNHLFLDQLIELRRKVPSSAGRNYKEAENSIAVVSLGDVNSYFVVLSRSKNTLFSVSALDTESSAEVYNSSGVTSSYQVVHSDRIYNSQYIRESRDCLNSAFLFDCRNCENCFGATNKRNAKYVWFNKQLTQNEWEKIRAEVDLGSRSQTQKWLAKFNELVNQAPWPENFNENCENSTGEYLTKATNCEMVYYADGGARDEFHTSWSLGNCERNAYASSMSNAQDNYFSCDVVQCNKTRYSYLLMRCQNVEYSTECYDCENVFGCVGLRRKKFCILNKQYSENDYWKKLDELKCVMLERGEYGEFLPAKMSPAYFPEGGSVRYYLADPVVFSKAVNAHTFEADEDGALGENLSNATKVADSTEIPDSIDNLDDAWIGKPVFDAAYKRRFSLFAPEVTLYRKLRVAPPVSHHVKRVLDLTHTANTGVFESCTCETCQEDVTISRNPTYPNRRIFCKACYLEYIEKNG
ncbi:MAG: hypothetical protein UY82_C0004G0018 [Candidatus Uhrbacteria bacterium GW2011_GWC2_53_7]|uniref:Uncharacterized protein n=1 Tax=Candidatus Uhrbacteria bacterium GW2011_GWC2_53_7 TaxID=1618986 RepID=A0A0G1Y0P5_9BACT|nr:MAG: hypothetical protein UY82_C0004G0018 [Candidatus Uhrbacteria bacterium GW2011_GWC2_53_7]